MALFEPFAGRAEQLKLKQPELTADVTLYSTANGGKKHPAMPGWGCPCVTVKAEPLVGYDGWPLLGDIPLHPGDTRRVGFVFLSSDEAARVIRAAGKFYLWEGKYIGEATVVE
jgi:hypothetical protein